MPSRREFPPAPPSLTPLGGLPARREGPSEEGSSTREVINEYVNHSGISSNDVNTCMELGSPEAIKGAVEAGLGISILSRTTVVKELRLGTLVSVPLDPPLERPFSSVHQKQKFRARIMDELLNFARTYCKTH